MDDPEQCAGCGKPAESEDELSHESGLCAVCQAARVIANIYQMRDAEDPVEQDRRRRISASVSHTRRHKFGPYIQDPLPIPER